MPHALSNRHSRWYKKQVLARSDRALKASLEAQGHSFKSKRALLQEKISHAMRQASVTPSDISTGNGLRLTSSVRGSSQTLRDLGFLPCGQGFMRLAHSTWKIVSKEGDDVEVHRLEEETANAASFAPRKKASRGYEALHAQGWPSALLDSMSQFDRAAHALKPQKYTPPSRLVLAGLPARVAGYTDTHFLVEFEGSGITCFQKISSCLADDGHARIAALQASAESLIPYGLLTPLRRASFVAELEADETLTKDDVANFVAQMDEAAKAANLERVSGLGSLAFGDKSAQDESDAEVVAKFHETWGGMDDVRGHLTDWNVWSELSPQTKAEVDSGSLSDAAKIELWHTLMRAEEEEWPDEDDEDDHEAKTAQSVQSWTQFNDVWVCDYTPTLHGMIKQETASPDAFHWELYSKGKICDSGSAPTLLDAQRDCGIMVSLIDEYH